MTEKQVLIPGPDHPITVTPSGQTVTVRFGDRIIAKTDQALVLQESTYRPVHYLPLLSPKPRRAAGVVPPRRPGGGGHSVRLK